MRSRALLRNFIFILLVAFSTSLFAQSAEEALYNSALKAYVDKLLIRFGKSNIERERFLVQQLRMVNNEMKSRISGISEIRENYFDRLDNLLAEVQALKGRLSVQGSQSLSVFVVDVEKKIQSIIDDGTINYNKQKAIEEAVQLLYIAEEMVQLDPNSNLEQNPDFNKNLSQTKSQLRSSFGEGVTKTSSSRSGSVAEVEPTVFDVYKEWKKTELIKYQVRWTDVQIMKRRLYNKGTVSQQENMFKRELRNAAEAFNYGQLELAERSFSEILSSYKNLGNLDDVLFYHGQSNYLLGRYHQAEEDFNNFTIEYPSSPFLTKAYLNLMHIAFHFKNYDQVLSYYRNMRSILPASDPQVYKMTFMAAVSALKNQRFDRCIELAFEIPSNSELFRESQFILAEAYAGVNNLEESKNIFESLIASENVEPEFRFTVLLKLGYLSYEGMDYFGALKYFDQIPGSFSEYDRVLIGYGWTLYKIEIEKSITQTKDFSTTQKYLEALLDNFYGSDYLLEARTLLGYVMQLQENVDAALDNYEYVFNAKDVKQLSDSMNTEYDLMNSTMKDAKRMQNKALEQNNAAAFSRAYRTVRNLRAPLNQLSYMDMSSSGVAVKGEVNRLNKQLKELERLKQIAQERGKTKLVKRIETMELKIYRAVNSISITRESKLGLNYFDEHPLARKESIVQHNNTKILKLREDTQRQREEIASKIAATEFQIQDARAQKDYRKMIHLELSKERMLELSEKLDFLDTRAYANELLQTNIDLKHWANYGAFGMTNVRFAIRNKKAEEIASFQKQIEQINEFLEIRKRNIEHTISQIDDEITLMTRRVRRQERIREREELKRQFEESYFDTHDTELDYDQGSTTEMPKLQDEEE